MKKTILLLIAIISFNLSQAQEVTPNEKEEVKQLIQDAFDSVWSTLDSKALKKYHTDDFILLEHGELWNNDTIAKYQARALKNNPAKRVNSFKFIKLEKQGTSIWVAYDNYAKFYRDDKLIAERHWLESAIAIPTKNGWKLKMMHSTRVPKN